MKKIFTAFFAVVVLITSIIPSYAQEIEDYDIIVDMADVILYDDSVDGVHGVVTGMLVVTVRFNNIERFNYMSVNLDFNKELMRYETSVEVPERACIYGCSPTSGGVGFFARLGEMAEPDTAYSRTATGYIKVSGTGEHNIKLNVDVRDKNDNPVDVNVKFEAPYEKIVAASAVTVINRDALTYTGKYALVDYKTKVSELVGNEEIRAGAVMDSTGNILAADANIPNGAFIVAMYEGYVADKVNICVMEDVNCDGKVTAADARLALRHSARMENLDGVRFIAADVNKDNKVTAADARLILRKPAGLA